MFLSPRHIAREAMSMGRVAVLLTWGGAELFTWGKGRGERGGDAHVG